MDHRVFSLRPAPYINCLIFGQSVWKGCIPTLRLSINHVTGTYTTNFIRADRPVCRLLKGGMQILGILKRGVRIFRKVWFGGQNQGCKFGFQWKTAWIWNNLPKKGCVFAPFASPLSMGLADLLADIKYTVQPPYNSHPWDSKKVAVVGRWPLWRGQIYSKTALWDIKNWLL